MIPLFGAMYNEPGDLLACEDYTAATLGGTDAGVPSRWLRTMLASMTADGCSYVTLTGWHVSVWPALEVELDMLSGAVALLRRR